MKKHKTTPGKNQCLAAYRKGAYAERCTLQEGHKGPHKSGTGRRWHP